MSEVNGRHSKKRDCDTMIAHDYNNNIIFIINNKRLTRRSRRVEAPA